jgi:hypothetical protein
LELQIAIKLDRNGHLCNRELLDLGVGTAGELGCLGSVGVSCTSDTLGVGESSLAQSITLSERAGTTPSTEIHASIASEGASGLDRSKVIALGLLRVTLVVGVTWARE